MIQKATNITPTTPAAARGGQADDEHDATGQLHDRRQPGVELARLHAQAREPAGGALDLAAAPDVVVAVGDHRHAHHHPQDQRAEIDTGRVEHRWFLPFRAVSLGAAAATDEPTVHDRGALVVISRR
ncbi:MAG: hypothetical protein R2699_16085 [Acidimicrobiales bacterium]